MRARLTTAHWGWLSLATTATLLVACPSSPPPQRSRVASVPIAPSVASTSPFEGEAVPAATIACGAKSCTAGREICCFLHAYDAPYRGECVAADEVREPYACLRWFGRTPTQQVDGMSGIWNAVSLECDDSSDCADGARCCYFGSPGGSAWGDPFGTRCVTGGCGAELFCSAEEPCPQRFGCTDLPTAAWACGQASDTPRSENQSLMLRACFQTDLEVGCGGLGCQGETPVCCWNLNTNSGYCAPEYETCPEHTVFCDDHSDCTHGARCCASGTAVVGCAARCDFSGDPEAMRGSHVCQSDADCPIVDGVRQHCEQDLDPDELRFYPPEIRSCVGPDG